MLQQDYIMYLWISAVRSDGSGTMQMPGRPEAHVIEILTESTPMAYRAYLRERGVSYVLAGKDKLDCPLAMEKLSRCF